jgi:hypothetical protein
VEHSARSRKSYDPRIAAATPPDGDLSIADSA